MSEVPFSFCLWCLSVVEECSTINSLLFAQGGGQASGAERQAASEKLRKVRTAAFPACFIGLRFLSGWVGLLC